MNGRIIWVLGFAVFALEQPLPAQSEPSRSVALAAPGQRITGAAWKSGRHQWLVLVRKGESSRLEVATPRLVSGKNSHTGADTTLELSRVVDGEPLVLLAGKQLQPGIVQTAWARARFLYPGESVSLRLGQQWSWLAAYGRAVPGPHDTIMEDYQLVLGHQTTNDTIAAFQRFGLEGHPEIRWAGDLDRDGKIDLIADLTTHYAGSRLVLFLSGSAKAGHLVAEAGRVDLPGC